MWPKTTKKWPFLESKNEVRSKMLMPTGVPWVLEHPFDQQIVNRANGNKILTILRQILPVFWQLALYVHNVTQNDQKMALLEEKNGVRPEFLIPTAIPHYRSFAECKVHQMEPKSHRKIEKRQKVPRAGLEPATFRSSVWRSPNWAIWALFLYYYGYPIS